jgi:hypothetical protein
MSKPNFKRPAISKSVNLRDAVYAYVSSCCETLAEKPAVKENEGALGKWRCSGCRKRCTVRPADKSKFAPTRIEPVQQELVVA